MKNCNVKVELRLWCFCWCIYVKYFIAGNFSRRISWIFVLLLVTDNHVQQYGEVNQLGGVFVNVSLMFTQQMNHEYNLFSHRVVLFQMEHECELLSLHAWEFARVTFPGSCESVTAVFQRSWHDTMRQVRLA